MLQESKKKQYEWKVNSFGIKQILKYRKRPNTVCGNVLPACADQETFSRGVLCIILFSREEGWGASEAYFREFYDVNLIDLNLTNFHPTPPQQSHTWPMKLTATWTFCNSLSDVVGSSLCDFKIISKQPAVFCFYMTGGCLTTPGRVMYGDVVMWNTDKVFNCPLPQPVIKQCFLKSTCKITFHESFMAWFTFF